MEGDFLKVTECADSRQLTISSDINQLLAGIIVPPIFLFSIHTLDRVMDMLFLFPF